MTDETMSQAERLLRDLSKAETIEGSPLALRMAMGKNVRDMDALLTATAIKQQICMALGNRGEYQLERTKDMDTWRDLSRKHAKITNLGTGIQVEDTSTNGTFVHKEGTDGFASLHEAKETFGDEDLPLTLQIPLTGTSPEQSLFIRFEKLPHVSGEVSIASPEHPNRNEDNLVNRPDLGLYAVMDGNSKPSGGEIASDTAAKAFTEFFRDKQKPSTKKEAVDIMAEAFMWAKDRLQETRGTEKSDTTVTVVNIFEIEGNKYASVGHCGDSRCFLIRNDKLTQITEDEDLLRRQARNAGWKHKDVIEMQKELVKIRDPYDAVEVQKYLEERGLHPEEPLTDMLKKNRFEVITGALGSISNEHPPQVYNVEIQEGDTLVLVTDGVVGSASGHHLENLEGVISLALQDGLTAQQIAEKIVSSTLAQKDYNPRFKPDDITAVVVKL